MTTISRWVAFHIHQDNHAPTSMGVCLSWDSADPCAVTALFPAAKDTPRWVFARDLLAGGILTPTGCGDVKILPAVHGDLRVVLDSPSGHAEFTVDADEVTEFVAETFEVVPAGSEYDVQGWDFEAALMELLDKEAA